MKNWEYLAHVIFITSQVQVLLKKVCWYKTLQKKQYIHLNIFSF